LATAQRHLVLLLPLVPESQRYQHLPAKVEQPHSVVNRRLAMEPSSRQGVCV